MTFDLSSLGWDEEFRATYGRCARPDLEPARVTGLRPGVCSLLTATGATRASIGGGVLALGARDPDRLPCCGDWVVLRAWPDGRSTVEAVLPRRAALRRPAAAPGARGGLLAANVDAIGIVLPAQPVPDAVVTALRDIARQCGIKAIVLAATVDPDAVRDLIQYGRTLALIGPPGAPRSTVVDVLVGARVLPRGPTLVPLPGGGCVLDTPDLQCGHARTLSISSIDIRRLI